MKMILVFSIALMTINFTTFSIAEDSIAFIELSEDLVVDQRLIDLLQFKNNSAKMITEQLENLQLSSEQLNAAEQYIVLVLRAIAFEKEGDFDNAIELLEQAHTLDDKISKKQLNTPLFSQSQLILANSYLELKQFDKAYLAKKNYHGRLQNFTWDEHDKKVELLNEKYETQQKQQRNELLLSQSKLKRLELKELESRNNSQQINTLLIVAIMIVFLLLFIRQLVIRKQLVKLAKTDDLTQLPNRRSLFEQGEKLVHYAHKEKILLSIVVVDVDYFKLINDQHGHDVGDKVLKQLAVIGNEVMRSRDIFARLGGEEFVALLPDATLDEVKAVAERLREKLSVFDFTSLGITKFLSLSIGISALNDEVTNFEALLHDADSAMYYAKSHGRDQVAIYNETMNITTLSRVKRSVY
ncbi:MAG: GGDEF domain-containing protein [Colwellia sp.]|nr:GGDEF domain-containing protein [Colwellia sp.]